MRRSITATALVALMLIGFGAGAAVAGVDIYVDTSSQRMTVAVDGVPRYTWKVSTGKSGYSTPNGIFQPFRMEPDHFSTEWDNAPMPFSIFFTAQGHAIHGSPNTRRLGRAVSHGCIRLAPQDAATLYSLVGQIGMAQTKIVVADGRIASAGTPPKQPSVVPGSNRPLRGWPWERRRGD